VAHGDTEYSEDYVHSLFSQRTSTEYPNGCDCIPAVSGKPGYEALDQAAQVSASKYAKNF